MDKNELPAETIADIKERATNYSKGDLSLFVAYTKIATEYAINMHQVEQENAQLKQWKKAQLALLNPILDYGQSKEAGIPLGKSITTTVLDRCKKFDTARGLLQKFISRHEAGLLPDMFIYKEIKNFLK
jgi:hypothetical protein